MEKPGGFGHTARFRHSDKGPQRGEIEISWHIKIPDALRQKHSLSK
jgi:hypothetical protein